MNDKRLFAHLALALLICGLLGPFVVAIFGSRELALGFGTVAEIMALVFGVLSYNERIGKLVTAICAFFVLLAVTTTAVLIPIRERQLTGQREASLERMIHDGEANRTLPAMETDAIKHE